MGKCREIHDISHQCRVVNSYLLNTLYLALSHDDKESVQRIITLVNESHTKKRIVFNKECVELVERIYVQNRACNVTKSIVLGSIVTRMVETMDAQVGILLTIPN